MMPPGPNPIGTTGEIGWILLSRRLDIWSNRNVKPTGRSEPWLHKTSAYTLIRRFLKPYIQWPPLSCDSSPCRFIPLPHLLVYLQFNSTLSFIGSFSFCYRFFWLIEDSNPFTWANWIWVLVSGMGKLGKRARKFSRKNLQSVDRKKRKFNAMRENSRRNKRRNYGSYLWERVSEFLLHFSECAANLIFGF